MGKKNVLGRGLEALIDGPVDDISNRMTPRGSAEIDIEDIIANPFQPRTNFNEDSLTGLSESIRNLGLIQPVTVKRLENRKYQLISGERRLRAAKMAGLSRIPAYIRSGDDDNLLLLALIENLQRDDLNPIDTAIGFQRLIDEFNLTQEGLSQKVGKKRTTITNYLRLLKLPPEIQVGLINNQLSMGHARAIINIDDPDMQLELFNQIITDDLSVRQIEDMVRNLNKSTSDPTTFPVTENINDSIAKDIKSSKEDLPEEFVFYRSHLNERLGMDVNFKITGNGAGKIIISFNSGEELEKIMQLLDKPLN